MNDTQKDHKNYLQSRRTFAIISHPDAGKTTLTEKLLLLSGAIRLAGSVKAKKAKKFATSDWMELEKQRGISVSSSVMNFTYKNYVCNLLDTPGHKDFSEDTYRTLAAADAAIMLIDAAKGVEPQTIKLFEVCKLRKIPIFTFINKMDRYAKDPLELIDDIEKTLNLNLYPINWPISSGELFQGLIERETDTIFHYKVDKSNSSVSCLALDSDKDEEKIKKTIPLELLEAAREEFELSKAACMAFNEKDFQEGRISPMFFGSAMNNFGIELFLDYFLKHAPGPQAKLSDKGLIQPNKENFSGFIFKIQANMDPKHRDRIAFLRVVSGAFSGGMSVNHPRLGRSIKLSHPQQFFAKERTTLEKAYAGDIVGIYDPGVFSIGDTVVENERFHFEGMPFFAPELFACLKTTSALKRKQLFKGLMQLCKEGTIQVFTDSNRAASDPIVAAVGTLQFDVLLFRLRHEYNVDCSLETLPIAHAKWTDANSHEIQSARELTDFTLVKDINDSSVILFKNDFTLDYFVEKCPSVNLYSNNAKVVKNIMNV